MPSLVDWWPFEYALSWMERMRALLEDSGGWTAEDQRLINEHARALLMMASTPLDAPVVLPVQMPRPSRAPKPKPPRATNGTRNGHRVTLKRWSLNERLDAYKKQHGKPPLMAGHGRGEHARRVSLYEADDLPLVNGVIREMLGALVAIES